METWNLGPALVRCGHWRVVGAGSALGRNGSDNKDGGRHYNIPAHPARTQRADTSTTNYSYTPPSVDTILTNYSYTPPQLSGGAPLQLMWPVTIAAHDSMIALLITLALSTPATISTPGLCGVLGPGQGCRHNKLT